MAKSVYNDPLSQSFQVATFGGVFATSLELYFFRKDENIPVTIQIREMFNGYPTSKIVPFSEVTLYPSEVNVVDLDTEDPDPSLATVFTFNSPVYLQDGVEYALTVLANSADYELWYAVLGQDEYGTGIRISKTPYSGVMFKSNNASTWLPEPNADLKFKINRAVFDTGVTGSLILKNENPQPRLLYKNPIATTNGSSVVTVYHRNHGFFQENNGVPSSATLSGLEPATTYNGILGSAINGTHDVINVEMDTYQIDLGAGNEATGTGITGGTTVEASEQHVFNTFQANQRHITFAGTSAAWSYKATNGLSLADSTTTPYVKDGAWNALIMGENVDMPSAHVVADTANFAGNSFELRCQFDSALDNLSPVFDLERASVTTVHNRIDNPIGSATAGYNTVMDYYPETDPEKGSALAKYVTKVVQLNQLSTTLKTYLNVNRPSQSFVDVYYRVSTEVDTIDDLDWVEATPSTVIPITDNPADFNEIEYDIEPSVEFNVFQIKIVFRTRNTSNVPVVKALRSIALA